VYNTVQNYNLIIDSGDRDIFTEPLLSFHAHFGEIKDKGCSVPFRLQNITKLRCFLCIFPMNDMYTSKYYEDAKVSALTFQKLFLYLDQQPKRFFSASNDTLHNPYQILIADSLGYFVKFVPLDNVVDSWETPVNYMSSLQITVRPSASLYNPSAHSARPVTFPSLDVYPFSAIVYNRLAKTLTVTFATPLNERLVEPGQLMTFARIKFDQSTDYEIQLQNYIDQQRQFMVVAVTTQGTESDAATTNLFDTSRDGYRDKKITSVLLHFEFDSDATNVDGEQHAFDLDTLEVLHNVLFNRAFQYRLLFEVEHRTTALTNEESATE